MNELRKAKIARYSRHPLLTLICMNVLSELVWGNRPQSFLKRARYSELIPVVDNAIQRSVERSLYNADAYTLKRPDAFLFGLLKDYIQDKTHVEVE